MSASKIDLIWHKSNAGIKPLHDLGLDDGDVASRFEQLVEDTPKDKLIRGVVHFRGSHSAFHSTPEFSPFKGDGIRNRYDNSIVYGDDNQMRIVRALKRAGRLENTLVISTADHGEAMAEHGYSGHNHTFYEEEANVPMWVYWPEALEVPKVVDETVVTNADLLPTILSVLGLWRQQSLIEVQSMLTGQPLNLPIDQRFVLLQNQADESVKRPFGGAAVLKGTRKYILRVEGLNAWEEYFDLASDPKELHNLWTETPVAERQAIYDVMDKYPLSAATRRKYRPQIEKNPVSVAGPVLDRGLGGGIGKNYKIESATDSPKSKPSN